MSHVQFSYIPDRYFPLATRASFIIAFLTGSKLWKQKTYSRNEYVSVIGSQPLVIHPILNLNSFTSRRFIWREKEMRCTQLGI